MRYTYREINPPAPPIRRRIYPIQYGANSKIVGKSDPQNLSYSGAWEPTSGTIADLANHIAQGHPWMPALLAPDSRRYQVNAIHADVLALDIDDGMSIDEAMRHPFIAEHCALAIESSSSTPEHPKFRLVFKLKEGINHATVRNLINPTDAATARSGSHPGNPILVRATSEPASGSVLASETQTQTQTDPQQARVCTDSQLEPWRVIKASVTYLQERVGAADPSCKDASRFFFGAEGRQPFILDEFKSLPDTFVADALAWHAAKEREAERQYQAALARREQLRGDNPKDTYELVRQALSYIPPRQPGTGNYPECISVLMALYNEFGESDAIALGEAWSPSLQGSTWNISKKVASFRNSSPSRPLSLGSIFYLAKQHGFHFPEPPERPIPTRPALLSKAKQARIQKQTSKEVNWLTQVLQSLDVAVDWDNEPDERQAIGEARATIASRAIAVNRVGGEAETGFFSELEMASKGDRILYGISGQKGTGKSQTAIKSVVDTCNRSIKSAAIVAPTRQLCEGLAAVLGVPTIYTTPKASIVVLCPESAWKLKGRRFEAVIVDEADECLQRLAQGNLGNSPDLCREQFERIVREANTIVLAQDGLLKHSIATVARLGAIAPEQIQIVRRKRPATDINIRLYTDRVFAADDQSSQRPKANDAKFTWLMSLLADLEDGKRIAVPCGSQNAARELDRLLRARVERTKKIHTFDGRDSFPAARTAFCQSPDQWLEDNQIDVLIFTPVFNHGVSQASEYFDVQYEYTTPFESAERISQRGERVRDAIWGNRIQKRHIYLSYRGIARHPDPAIFTPAYWYQLIRGDKLTPLEQAKTIASTLGASAVLDSYQVKELAQLGNWCELPSVLAFEALQIYFKQEFLRAEWQGNGWSVESVLPLPSDVLEPLKKQWRAAKESLIEQRSRILAKCKNYQSIDLDCEETAGPIERTRLVKKALSVRTGEHEGIDDAQWLSAWVIAPGESGLNPVRVNALLNLAIQDPDQFRELQTLRALATIGSCATVEALPPSLPATEREMGLAALLVQCEAVRKIITGEVTQWDNRQALILEAANFARNHAIEFARLTRHNQRIHGLQFTERTPAIKCLHKMLQMVGLSTTHTGRVKQVHQYRLQVEADIKAKIVRALEQAKPVASLMRESYRLRTWEELRDHLQLHFTEALTSAAPSWDKYAQKLIGRLSDLVSELQLTSMSDLTEVLTRSKIPLWVMLSAWIRRAKSWTDFEKLGELFPTGVKQRIWDALGETDQTFRHAIWEMKPAN